ncbi:cation diffusion facilitator family transporter [Paenibacillus glycanilyticus]|uniref:cation diffusion facilitator family transporter n=1 Tax=Paenibacillus glycanilyticus TaxID=126569 RepID=UPI002042418E|nr:cation diffusion facilitator family transporter [Paenibacillus glycanilyticus]MCM3626122.1 cation diffusion facilitator family transporter [Paenibacillus glycanilyticus]
MESESKPSTIIDLLKRGSTSSATAALGNTGIAIVKAFAAISTGSGAMFASTMHSIADAVNQAFVFAGSVLAEKKPTRRFPTGFGRVINLFCMVAVIVVTVMAYETIREGLRLIAHPSAESRGFWLNLIVLLLSVTVDGFVLIKATKEIVHESRIEAKGLAIFPQAFKNVGRAAPPTRLVFFEDLVATTSALLALLAVVVTSFTSLALLDGVSTLLIGFLMICVAFKVGYDNMVGLIGVSAPKDVEDKVAKIIFSINFVTDIFQMRILQEGRYYHVEGLVELRPGLTLADADDIKFKIRDTLLKEAEIADVTIGIIEDNGVRNWNPEPVNT